MVHCFQVCLPSFLASWITRRNDSGCQILVYLVYGRCWLLIFCLQGMQPASISSVTTATDMWAVLWVEPWEDWYPQNPWLLCLLLSDTYNMKVVSHLCMRKTPGVISWKNMSADEYILPKIAERELRRFSNLRSTSSDPGMKPSLNEVQPLLAECISDFLNWSFTSTFQI